MARIPADETADAGPGVLVEHTFLIGDIRGYTRFTREQGDREAARLAMCFAELARDSVTARGGLVIGLRGDEALAVFESPAQAVRAAVELQAACIEEEELDPTLPLHVGIGIDSGEAVPVEDGYRGTALNRAARLCSTAGAGQVLVSAELAAQAGLIEGLLYADRGVASPKGFESGVELVEVVAPAPAARFPRTVREPEALPINLEPDGLLAGRVHELRWLRGTWRQARRGNGRIVFVSGPSQIGKTRLAAELAVFAAQDGAAIFYAGAGGTAAALGLAALRDALGAPGPALVVLDDLDLTADALSPALADQLDEIESTATLVLCLVRDPDATPALAELIERLDSRADGHRTLGPLGGDEIRAIAECYGSDNIRDLPVESIERASRGVPGSIHELVMEWLEQEATRRLSAAAEWLAVERSERRADLDFANNVIGLKLARFYAGGDAASLEDGACPYKGLAPFGAGDAQLYFGRERLVGELAARTVGSGMLAVVGASGSGKSSAIAAGLVPSLAAGLLPGSEKWTAHQIRPGPHPLAELESVGTEGNGGERLVLVVDQFEEIFTVCLDDDERRAFVDRLVTLAGEPDRAIVVVGIRGDYYGHCGAYPELASLLAANQVLVGQMSPDELRRAVELPARQARVRVESALASTLVGEVANEPGGLPLLSTALVELWFARTDGWLRLADHEQLGGVHGAVARLAEHSYENLSADEQEAARRLFLRLAGVSEAGAPARRRVRLSELDLERDPELASAVDRLTDDRLLTAHESSIEVAHEALFREWPRLEEWLADDAQGRELRVHLTQTAHHWLEQGRDAADLYRSARLSATLDWAATRPHELNDLEREFLAESRAENDRELQRQRRANRRLKALLAGAVVLLVTAVAAGALALVAQSNARHSATVALGRQLGAEAVSEPRIDRAMLLARESLALDRSLQTEGTLLATLLRSPALTGTFTVPTDERPQAVDVSPDGRTLAVVTNANVMHLFDTRTRRQIRTIPLANFGYSYVPGTDDLFAGGTGALPYLLVDARTGRTLRTYRISKLWETSLTTDTEPLVVSPNGRFAVLLWALRNSDGSAGATYAERWTIGRGGQSLLVPLHTKDVLAATVTSDGNLVVATDGAISTWNLDTMKEVGSARGPRLDSRYAAAGLSPDGRTLGYGLPDGSVHFFTTATGATVSGIGAHQAAVLRVVFAPDSRLAVSTGDDRVAIVWNPATGQALQRLTGHGGRVLGAAFARASRTLYTVSLDGTILQWDLGGGRRFGDTVRVGRPVPSSSDSALDPASPTPILAVSPDGRRFAVQGSPSTVALYATSSQQRVGKITLAGGDAVRAAAWSGAELVVGTDRGAVELWRLRGAPKAVSALHGLESRGHHPVRSLATADAGRLVAAVDGFFGPRPEGGGPSPEEGALAIWREGQLVGGKTIDLHTIGNGVAFSADSSMLAVATDDGRVLVLDPSTGRIERTIRPQTGALTVAFAADGTLATGSHAGIVDLWDPTTGKEIGHSTLVAASPVGSVAFDPTGKTFATTGGPSGGARIWVTSTEQQFGADLPGGEGADSNAAYTPDGRYLLVVLDNGTAFRWPAEVEAWEQHACAVAGRNLTREEWTRLVGDRPYARTC